MYKHKAQQKGGQVTAIKRRFIAYLEYYSNPNTCTVCGEVIHVRPHKKIGEARRKVFCNHSCAVKHTNARRLRACKPKAKTKRKPALKDVTKGELFERRANWQSARSSIQGHARQVGLAIYTTCAICGYDKHIEIAHIKSVSDFDDDAYIDTEINHPHNLVGLCPNHHWEFDHGHITIAGIGEVDEPLVS